MQNTKRNKRLIVRSAIIGLCLSAIAADVQGAAPADQLLANVTMELPDYVSGVDPYSLSRHQLAAIYMAMHSQHRYSRKVRQIRSIIGGRFSLRGLFYN